MRAGNALNRSERACSAQIGIGVSLLAEPLPHHPACGSAPGGSRS
jgi:hypothetical protein